MGLQYESIEKFDPKNTIENEFGPNVVFVIAVKSDTVRVDLRENGSPPPAKAGFPKENLEKLDDITSITVIPWEASPGCRTVYINGVAYERC